MAKQILSLKTVSKTTKVSVHENREQVLLINIRHSNEDLEKIDRVIDQLELRKNAVLEELNRADIKLSDIGIIVCRGGVLKPIDGGIYSVNEAMIKDLHEPMAEHESNLGALIAYDLVKMIGGNIKAITVDPACTDEMHEIAKVSGMPEIRRKSIMHTLSQRTVAKNFASRIGKDYKDVKVIVAHLGSGISVGAHIGGKIVDVNNGLDGDGPMSVARTGSLPVGQLIELCYSGKFSKDEILKKVYLNGGLKAYLGTGDAIKVEQKIKDGDDKAKFYYEALAYQLAKEIGGLATIFDGELDGIIITGGMAYSDIITGIITKKVSFIAPVKVYPGEREMEGLMINAYNVLNDRAEVIEYK